MNHIEENTWEYDSLEQMLFLYCTKDKPMDWATSQKVIDYMTRPGTHSEAYRSLELSHYVNDIW